MYFEKKKSDSGEEKDRWINNGVLYCSGLIAGEGLVGILLAVCAVIPFRGGSFADSFSLAEKFNLGRMGGLLFFAMLTATLVYFICRKDKKVKK